MPFPITKPKYYMTYRVVAASDASNESKQKAHYICDGSNDGAMITQAINDLPSDGGIVYLTEGTFNTSITIERNNIILMGAGRDSTTIQNIRINTGYSYITIQNLHAQLVQMVASNQYITVDSCRLRRVYLGSYPQHITVTNNLIEPLSTYGIDIQDTDYTYIANNYIQVTGYDYSMHIHGFHMSRLVHNFANKPLTNFHDCWQSTFGYNHAAMNIGGATHDCIFVGNVGNITVTSTNFYDNIFIGNNGNISYSGNQKNTFINNTGAISLTNSLTESVMDYGNGFNNIYFKFNTCSFA